VNKCRAVTVIVFSIAVLVVPYVVSAQQVSGRLTDAPGVLALSDDQQSNVPPAAQQAEVTVEEAVRRFRVGVEGGVGLDPEIIMFGAHAAFAPIFRRGVEFRPGIDFGIGELTTQFGVNLEVLYVLPGATSRTRWTPYAGAGPNFALSHRGFTTDDDLEDDDPNRFDFSDTDFEGGFNFIAGARSRGGTFFELKATAYGVATVRLLGGFNF
jgi:hypothetical protein